MKKKHGEWYKPVEVRGTTNRYARAWACTWSIPPANGTGFATIYYNGGTKRRYEIYTKRRIVEAPLPKSIKSLPEAMRYVETLLRME